ncbi:Conserved hypothetical protein [Geobacillus thermodenitrificans NG80-2]|uniref:Uncharacterized protein n=1 Tax=Geobacillus thermodenitrificans (strain NG80-2) TaxID=420246 RepID=A4IQH4_GEOTN|nr:Conserved hypothetical protein [Geobacillus thermodenitrificans NG80-2]
MKRTIASSLLAVMLLAFPAMVAADAAPGDVIVTLGENLTNEQKQKSARGNESAGRSSDGYRLKR